MNTENTNTEEVMTAEDALKTLEIAYRVFKPNAKSRTFMTLAQSMLGKELSARGIVDTYKMDFYKYMLKHFSNPASEHNAVKVYGIDKVVAYLEALNEVICANPDLKEAVDAIIDGEETPAPSTKFEAAIAEAAEQVAEELNAESIPAAAATAHEFKEALEVTPKPQPAPPVLEKPKHGLLLDIDSIIRQSAENFLLSDSVGIRAGIEDKLRGNLLNNTLVVLPSMKTATKEEVIVKGRLHKEFKEALEVTIIEQQAFLGGPTGSGKTILAGQIAEAMGLRFAHISCTAGMSEAHLLGRMIADGSYIGTEFIDFFENGGVFLADEVDAADPNTTLILNSALANGMLSVPNRKDKPNAKRHPKFYFVCAANTWGKGSEAYNGRNILDGAFMDRFATSKVEVTYDIDLEREILKDHPATAKRLWAMRDAITKERVRQNLSTRVFAAAARNFAAGRTEAQLMKRFLTGWTEQEIKKVIGGDR